MIADINQMSPPVNFGDFAIPASLIEKIEQTNDGCGVIVTYLNLQGSRQIGVCKDLKYSVAVSRWEQAVQSIVPSIPSWSGGPR